MTSIKRDSPGARLLTLAGIGMLCIALSQAIMPFSRSLVRAFDGPDDWSTPLLFVSSFAVAGFVAILSLFPFSGAGRVRRLPLLRGVLTVLGVLLVWRGIFLPLQVAGAAGYGPAADEATWGGILSSAATLSVGGCCLAGLVLSWRALAKRGDSGGEQAAARERAAADSAA